ncbi:MAG: TIGR02556 family CRISPR-associated protein, partial [Candidatus Saccharicenans sp.]|nr:TIGR02556 family CRISPR-associated protein [Candidatus Saccharicenans sp.]
MLSAIKDIGKITFSKPNEEPDYKEAKILSINIDVDNSSNLFVYQGVELEDFQSALANLYLFKKRASKGNSPAPFSPLIEADKTLKKIIVWINKCQRAIEREEVRADNEVKKTIIGVTRILKEKREPISKDISKKIDIIPKKTKKFLTLKINGRYLGEYEIFTKCVDHFAEERRKRSLNIGVCSICAEHNKEVSGKTDVFKFYTIDKPGFITGGFNPEDAWKNFPVCKDCSQYLQKGKNYIEKNLNFKFYGFNYLLIPRLLLHESSELETILNLFAESKKEISLKRKTIRRITDDDQEILETLTELGDLLTLNFLFLQIQRSADRILMLIEDIFPSRIKKIFEAKNKVDEIFDQGRGSQFTFGTIRTFFSKSDSNKKTNDLDKYFLDIVRSVFTGAKLDKSFLIKFFMP